MIRQGRVLRRKADVEPETVESKRTKRPLKTLETLAQLKNKNVAEKQAGLRVAKPKKDKKKKKNKKRSKTAPDDVVDDYFQKKE